MGLGGGEGQWEEKGGWFTTLIVCNGRRLSHYLTSFFDGLRVDGDTTKDHCLSPSLPIISGSKRRKNAMLNPSLLLFALWRFEMNVRAPMTLSVLR